MGTLNIIILHAVGSYFVLLYTHVFVTWSRKFIYLYSPYVVVQQRKINPFTPTAGWPAVLSSAQVSSAGEPAIGLKRYGHRGSTRGWERKR